MDKVRYINSWTMITAFRAIGFLGVSGIMNEENELTRFVRLLLADPIMSSNIRKMDLVMTQVETRDPLFEGVLKSQTVPFHLGGMLLAANGQDRLDRINEQLVKYRQVLESGHPDYYTSLTTTINMALAKH